MCFGIAILLRCLNMMVGAKTIDRVRHRQSSEEEFVVEMVIFLREFRRNREQ